MGKIRPHDNYKPWSPQPDPATIRPCPHCGCSAEVWQFSEALDTQLLRVVMCKNGIAFGPQIKDGVELFAGCMLYMPPDSFYRPRTVEAIQYWNQYADALIAMRASRVSGEDFLYPGHPARKDAAPQAVSEAPMGGNGRTTRGDDSSEARSSDADHHAEDLPGRKSMDRGNSSASDSQPAVAAPVRSWRKKDAEGDDLIDVWKRRPAHSDERLAVEIIEQLERELAAR